MRWASPGLWPRCSIGTWKVSRAVQAEKAETAAAAVVKGPRETCGRRVFVALVNCMNRECAKPENRRLPECRMYRPPD